MMKRDAMLVLVFCTLLCGCEEEPPAEPVHHVGNQEIPVLEVEVAAGASPDDFQLIQLKDGHDYWYYRDRGGERGYAGLAHSPECAKCMERAGQADSTSEP